MGHFKDLTGKVFGRLTVIKRVSPIGVKHIQWECLCECGKISYPSSTALTSGRTYSCGCRAIERIAKVNKTHGQSKTAVYMVWRAMKDRCENPSNWARKYYQDKGITYSEDWKSFENFIRDMGERPQGMTLERIDNKKGYCKENCKWASRHDQRINQDCNAVYTVNGVSGTLSQVIEGLKLTLSPARVHARIKRGWSVEEAFLIPLSETGKESPDRPRKRRFASKRSFTVRGVTAPLSELALLFAPTLSYATVSARVKLGWDIEKALFTPLRGKE
jgi:hypothetical protein